MSYSNEIGNHTITHFVKECDATSFHFQVIVSTLLKAKSQSFAKNKTNGSFL